MPETQNAEIFAHMHTCLCTLLTLLIVSRNAAKEPSELPAASLLAGVIAEQRGWCSYASWVYALLHSYYLSRIAVQTIADGNSPVGRWFTNWIHTRKKEKKQIPKITCFCAAEPKMVNESGEFNPKPRLRPDLLCSEEVFLQLYCQCHDDVLFLLRLPWEINLLTNTNGNSINVNQTLNTSLFIALLIHIFFPIINPFSCIFYELCAVTVCCRFESS